MTQLNFLNGQSKLVKTIFYLLVTALITGYAGVNGWVFSQVIARPSVLESYQKTEEAKAQELRIKEELSEHKRDTCLRIDRLEVQMDKRFDRLENLIDKINK